MRLFFLFILLIFQSHYVLAESPRVLFDQSHQQAFVIEKNGPLQLQNLAQIFLDQGWQVQSQSDALTAEDLATTDALVISGAFTPLRKAEVNAVLNYLKRGGKLAIMIHIGQPLTNLLHPLGVEFGNLVINEKQNQADGKTLNFTVSDLTKHPLTEQVKHFSIYGGWPLRAFTDNGLTIASSSPHSWVDTNRDQRLSKGDLMQPFAVVISGHYGLGSFTVFADDAIFQNRFLTHGNKVLAENLSRWLKHQSSKGLEI